MSKVALVTGGTRGIGAAISIGLKNAGYTVAANYGGNDEAANKFKAETGIAVFKWDVGNFESCAAGIKDVEGAFNMCRNVIDGMRERNHGRIVNISSINGQKGQMGQTNYSAAKAGIIGFTKALAQETAKKGITVNVICPGYIDTEMVQAVPPKVLEGIIATIPVGRLGKADEIAKMTAFLASDDAAFITGATMTVNGAQYIAG